MIRRGGRSFRRPAGARPMTPHDDEDEEPDHDEGLDADAEASYACWACGEEIVVPVDPTMGMRQDYVEDCPVCCRPNELHVEIDPEDGHVRCWSDPVG